MKSLFYWFIFFTIILVFSINARASNKFGSVIFHQPELQKTIDEELGPHVIGSEAIAFIEKVISQSGGHTALVIWTGVDVFKNIDFIAVAIARFGENQPKISRVNAGLWARNLLKNKEYQLASYQAIISMPNDIKDFKNEPKAFQKLVSPNQVAMTFFIVLDGKKELMICTNGYQEDYGENSPVKRSATFAKLHQMIDEIWSSDPGTVDEILKIEGE